MGPRQQLDIRKADNIAPQLVSFSLNIIHLIFALEPRSSRVLH